MNEEKMFIVIFTVLAVCVIIPIILFFLAQQNTLKAIQPANRDMTPANVWLQLVPIFNLYYQFVVVNKISSSIDKEIESRMDETTILPAINSSSNAGSLRNIGIIYCVLSLLSAIPMVGTLCSIAALVCLIIYWVRLVDFKKKIEGAV